MIFLLAAALTSASGIGLLRLLRLETGRLAVDVPLGWFVGSAWFAASAFSFQAFLGTRVNAVVAALLLALPLVAWAVVQWRRPAARKAPEAGGGRRWIPRPAWLFAFLAIWSVLVAAVVALHGMSTPTHTDDAFRVRAYAPVLVGRGDSSPGAREVIAMAGPVPAFVPAVAGLLGSPVDPFQVNATIVLTFIALLVLLVAQGSERGSPEAGWGAVFALTSMPLLAYHATSTYSDAWLAMYLGAAFAFLVSCGQRRDPADAGRALLLLLGAALVKREGEFVAAPAIGLLLLQAAWGRRGDGLRVVLRLAPPLAAYGVVVAARIAFVGLPGAFPFLRAAIDRSTVGEGGAAVAAGTAVGGPGASTIFAAALFDSGNFGLLYWVLALAVPLLLGRIRRDGLGWSGAVLAVLFAETAVSAIWLFPQFTLDQSTVYRSLLPVSVAAAVWLAALLAAACAAPPSERSMASRRSSKVG
jgi:hypothetical protein